MSQPASFRRRDSLTIHPPYGLFLDPHRGQHNWTAAGTRVLLTVIGALVTLFMVVVFGPH